MAWGGGAQRPIWHFNESEKTVRAAWPMTDCCQGFFTKEDFAIVLQSCRVIRTLSFTVQALEVLRPKPGGEGEIHTQVGMSWDENNLVFSKQSFCSY